MSRSSWKRTYFTQQTVRGLKKLYLGRRFRNRIVFDGSSQIAKLFSGMPFLIYNGSVFNRVTVSDLTTNKKFGELSITRKPFFFPKKKAKGKKR